MTSPTAHEPGHHHGAARPGPGAGSRRLRAAATPPPREEPQRCWTCGRGPVNPMERITMTAQWLINGDEGLTLRRLCPGCRPAGTISDLTCSRCGDGPLLVGDLAADPTGHLPGPARQWLTDHGWDLTHPLDPICPGCSTASRRAARPGSGVRR